jgi:hypothetical protein
MTEGSASMFLSSRRRHVAGLVVVLVIAGCGGGGSSSTKSKDQSPAPAVAVALTEEQYQDLLEDSADTVNRALTSVRGAGSRDGLQTRLERSATALEEAAGELGASKAPDAAASGHAEAQAAMQGLSAALESAAGKVESGGLCTGPAAVAQITRSAAAGELRTAAKGLRARALAPKRQPMPALRLKNGSVLSRKGGGGPGILVIKNGNGREGVVKLVAGGKRMSIYVAGSATARVTQIPDGNFDVYFASGVSWDGKRNTFSRSCGFTRFERKMKFVSSGGQYTQFTITLNAVAGGNAPSRQIDPDDFPRG